MSDAPYRHIACCVDDGEASRRGLAEARRLRALGPGRLSLLHVAVAPIAYMPMAHGITWMPEPEAYASWAETWLRTQTSGEEVPVLLEGHPGDAVCRWAREHDVDLLVAAAHRGVAARAFLGSFASYVAYHSPCAVLLVR